MERNVKQRKIEKIFSALVYRNGYIKADYISYLRDHPQNGKLRRWAYILHLNFKYRILRRTPQNLPQGLLQGSDRDQSIALLSARIDQMESGFKQLKRSLVQSDLLRIDACRSHMQLCAAVSGSADTLSAEQKALAGEVLWLKETQPKVSIIILNRNGKKHLMTLLPSLRDRRFYRNFEIICVDNASNDDSMAYLESWKDTFAIKTIYNAENRTFSAANNQAAAIAEGDYLLFLNNDTEVTDGWLDEMLYAAYCCENAGAIGAKLIYPDAGNTAASAKSFSIQHNGIAFTNADRFGKYYVRPYNMDNQLPDFTASERFVERAAVTAAVLLVKKTAFLSVGGYDERYNYGYEDVDLGLRLVQHGYRNYVCQNCLVYHYEFGTQSTQQSDVVSQRRRSNIHIFQSKWQTTILNRILKEKLTRQPMYSENPLVVAFAVTEATPDTTAGDYFTARELATALESRGIRVKFLARRGSDDWYRVGYDTDVVISMLDAYDFRQMTAYKPSVVKIGWARNWFERWCTQDYFNQLDIVLASSQTACAYIREHSTQQPLLFPIATNASAFAGEIIQTEEEAAFFASDYVFTGSYWNSAREIEDLLVPSHLPFQFRVFGCNWETSKQFAPYTKGFVSYAKMPKVYKNTKIVIDDANAVTKQFGAVNSRVYDALAAGALVLTNGLIGANETFHGMLPCFSSQQELESLVTYYLTNEQERQTLVNKLRKFVLSNHTYDIRAQKLCGILSTYIEKKSTYTLDERRIDILHASTERNMEQWGDYYYAVSMKKSFEKHGYTVRLVARDHWYEPSDAACLVVLRGIFPYIRPDMDTRRVVMWNISHPDDVTMDEYNTYDHVFFAGLPLYEKMRNQLAVPSSVLLQCTDLDQIKFTPTAEKKYELLFVGNSRNQFRQILQDLLPTPHDLSVYGSGWRTSPSRNT